MEGSSPRTRCLALVAVLVVAAAGPAAPAQLLNDNCDAALANGFSINVGLNGPYPNNLATASGIVPTCAVNSPIGIIGPGTFVDMWFPFVVPVSTTYVFDLASTQLAFPAIAVFDGNSYSGPGSCGTLPELGCSFGPGGSISLSASAGDLLMIQVGTLLPGDIGPIFVNIVQTFTLDITAPSGPGSLAVINAGGPPSGVYITAVTFNAGAYPVGWFYGIDIPLPTLLQEFSFGVPFTGLLDGIGGSTFSAPAGVPSGLTFYAVSIALSPGFVPLASSAPIQFTTP